MGLKIYPVNPVILSNALTKRDKPSIILHLRELIHILFKPSYFYWHIKIWNNIKLWNIRLNVQKRCTIYDIYIPKVEFFPSTLTRRTIDMPIGFGPYFRCYTEINKAFYAVLSDVRHASCSYPVYPHIPTRGELTTGKSISSPHSCLRPHLSQSHPLPS